MAEAQSNTSVLLDPYNTNTYILSYLENKKISKYSQQILAVQDASARMLFMRNIHQGKGIVIKENQQSAGFVIIDESCLVGISTLKKIEKVYIS